MDEAFQPIEQILKRMLSFTGEFIDKEEGVRSHIYECHIESPVELSVVRDENGALQIGSTPPLYYVETSIVPSFHKLSFTARLSDESDDL